LSLPQLAKVSLLTFVADFCETVFLLAVAFIHS